MRFDIGDDLATARALPPEAYTDPAVAALEARRVFARSWQPVARLEQLASTGAYVTTELAGEPLLIVRDGDALRGYFNVCPHRAGPLARGCGQRQSIQCGYHGWTFRLDGGLLRAPGCGGDDGVDLADVRLVPVEVARWGPLVLAAIDPTVPAETWLAGIAAPAASLRWVMRRDYELACNWKVYVDNYLEGYHIPIVHPELYAELDHAAYRTETDRWWSRQHAPLRPLAGDAADRRYHPDQQADADALYYWAFPGLMLNIYQGQLQTNVVVPLAPDRTRVTFEWFAATPPADPATDETWRRLVDFSDLLQEQDTMICTTVQRNLGSRGAQRGRYAPRHERGVHHFHRLLAEALAAACVLALIACGGGSGDDDARRPTRAGRGCSAATARSSCRSRPTSIPLASTRC